MGMIPGMGIGVTSGLSESAMWEEVVDKISKLRSLDHNFTVLGAEIHHYQFNPPAN